MKIRLDDDYELKAAWLRCADIDALFATRFESVEVDKNRIIFLHNHRWITALELPIRFTRFHCCEVYWFLTAWLEKHRPELFL